MTATAELKHQAARIDRADLSAPILFATGRTGLSIRAGTVIEIDGIIRAFETDTPIELGEMIAGHDYAVDIGPDGKPFVELAASANPLAGRHVAGFHFAPGGNATGCGGGDTIPAINPYSIWDLGFRPSCPDPRGMTLVDVSAGRRVWVDIYLLGVQHRLGTSRCGAPIADGRNLPDSTNGEGRAKKLDYATAVEIYASHDKRLLGAEEFFAAAYGVKERCSREDEPEHAGELIDGAERFISRFGLFDATGTMWQWATDGHPDDPRPSILGGSWVDGDDAGSRCAYLDNWADDSGVNFGCRGACDHL